MNSDKIRQKTKDFYNQSAKSFSQTRGYWWDDLRFIKEYIFKNGKSNGDKALDFGCGNGRLVKFLRKNDFQGEYIGVDNSEELIKIAEKHYPDENFLTMEKENKLPFGNEEFNEIFSIAVFHHFNPQMAQENLKELKRIIKKDGILIITVWNLWDTKYKKYLLKNLLKGNFNLMTNLTFKDSNRTYERPCYWWRKSQLEKIIKKNGFEIEKSFFTFNKKGKKRNMCFICKNK